MVMKLRESKLFVLFLFVIFVFQVYAFRNYFNNDDTEIKYGDNNFIVDTVTGDVSVKSGTIRSCLIITQTRQNAQPLRFEYKYTTMHFKGNLLTSMDPESEWIEVQLTPAQ
jgi:hypothetical protein